VIVDKFKGLLVLAAGIFPRIVAHHERRLNTRRTARRHLWACERCRGLLRSTLWVERIDSRQATQDNSTSVSPDRRLRFMRRRRNGPPSRRDWRALGPHS